MIKTLLLILEPKAAWDRIYVARRALPFILVAYLLPLLIIPSIGEGYRLSHYDRPGAVKPQPPYILAEAVLYEIGQFFLSIGVVFIGAKQLKALGETFHGRHTFNQAFTTVAYGLGPVFLLRLLDMFENVSPWVSWGIGICVSMSVLYHGVWRMMEPDPPHAFGLYFMGALLLFLTTGLARFVTCWYLEGRFTRLETIVSSLARRLHSL